MDQGQDNLLASLCYQFGGKIMPHRTKRITDFGQGVESLRKKVEMILDDLREQGRIDYPSEVYERLDKAALAALKEESRDK